MLVETLKKLKAVTVRVAAMAEHDEDKEGDGCVVVVTNAKYVEAGKLVVVALPGAIVPAGADPEDGGTLVAKASVGGRMSNGMLCDSRMLGWVGGAAGVAVSLDASVFNVGQAPPAKRPNKR